MVQQRVEKYSQMRERISNLQRSMNSNSSRNLPLCSRESVVDLYATSVLKDCKIVVHLSKKYPNFVPFFFYAVAQFNAK